ncbi:orn/Lys/Arg decarboxylase, N-terminal domain protein, partial [Vibrio parahaemolyticus EKP-028]
YFTNRPTSKRELLRVRFRYG